MKKNSMHLFLAILLCSPAITFSAVGTNNFTFNVGGTFNVSSIYGNANQTIPIKERTTAFLGGGFNMELGHLYLSQGNVVTGADTRFGFGMNYDKLHTIGGRGIDTNIDVSFNTLSVYLGSTFVIGKKLNAGHLLFDIAGLDMGYFIGAQRQKLNNITANILTGNHFLLSINLPLGTQFIFNNGLIIGFRHQLDMAFAPLVSDPIVETDGINTIVRPNRGGVFGNSRAQDTLLSYSLTFSLGFAIGK